MIKRELQIFLIALSYFTRIPIPISIPISYDEDKASHILKYFPLIGILIAASSYFIFYLFHSLIGVTVEISIILSMIFSTVVTGALHEDGLADSIDGFGGGYGDREKILMIMKDSRIGSFGALSLIFSQLLKFYSLQAIVESCYPITLPLLLLAMISAHGLSRLLVFIYVYNHTNCNNEKGKARASKSKAVTNNHHLSDFFIAALISIGVIGIGVGIGIAYINTNTTGMLTSLLLVLILVLTPLYFIIKKFIHKRLAGYTGDTLGAIQQIFELTIYVIFSFMIVGC
ncbi:MAG: adenosylcobinamide-GDP ribazoletransferase [Oligoflexia bacterium]|nr:adenosylcobinamide-GDP ribazoletransferase [Oligoflexia bacterium]